MPLAEGALALQEQWLISCELAEKLVQLNREVEWMGLAIISGYRSVEEQIALGEEGRPAARPDRSTHTTCPATGADLWPLNVDPDSDGRAIPGRHIPSGPLPVKTEFGAAVRRVGLRWGGGSPEDMYGMPSDWNHVDLGPRR